MSERTYTVKGVVRDFSLRYLWPRLALWRNTPIEYQQEAYTSNGAIRRVREAHPEVVVTEVVPNDKPAFCR